MKKITNIIIYSSLYLNIANSTHAQSTNKLLIIKTKEAYLKTVQEDEDKALVLLKKYVPSIKLDIKYATLQNIFYKKLYPEASAYVRLPVAKALAKVQEELRTKGLSLKIYDAYRPYSVTVQMFEMLPDTLYMGLPWTGSKHNKGIALDLTLVNLKTGKELKMPTPFDALVYASHPEFPLVSDEVKQNRELLKDVMKRHGFVVDPMEWWHFNYKSSTNFEILDLPFKTFE